MKVTKFLFSLERYYCNLSNTEERNTACINFRALSKIKAFLREIKRNGDSNAAFYLKKDDFMAMYHFWP
jgi:hypothetical protein